MLLTGQISMVLALAALLLLPQSNTAGVARPSSGIVLRSSVDLVLVPVTVTDDVGRPILDLGKADFAVSEEKRAQKLVSFSRENAPVSVGIVVDLSGSMVDKIDKVRIAVNEILKSLEAEDEQFLVTFADRPELRGPLNSSIEAINNTLLFAVPKGGTALYDAVAMSVDQLGRARNGRKALFVISDGGDNHSRFTERQLRRLLEEQEVQVNAIGIHDRPARAEERQGPWVLEELARMTGGQHRMVEVVSDLPALAASMSLAVHDRYLLGYRPTPAGEPGRYRNISVKVTQPKGDRRTHIYARKGYRMP